MTKTTEISVSAAREYILKRLALSEENTAPFGSILCFTPQEWMIQKRDLYDPLYTREMVETVFKAVSELVAEGKAIFVPTCVSQGYMNSINKDGSSSSQPLGNWEFALKLLT